MKGESLYALISIGGDGTILRLAHKHPELKAPLFGINLGSLGFLADVPLSELYSSLNELLERRCVLHERMVIEGKSAHSSFFAINDIVIHRGKNPSLIDLSVHVDGIYVNSFAADGLIIATPIGSTAYNLAAGGPILDPATDALVLTPISAHTISNRPIVIKPRQSIVVEYISDASPVEVSADGILSSPLSPFERLTVHFSKERFKIFTLKESEYFSTIRTKLGWSGKMRSPR